MFFKGLTIAKLALFLAVHFAGANALAEEPVSVQRLPKYDRKAVIEGAKNLREINEKRRNSPSVAAQLNRARTYEIFALQPIRSGNDIPLYQVAGDVRAMEPGSRIVLSIYPLTNEELVRTHQTRLNREVLSLRGQLGNASLKSQERAALAVRLRTCEDQLQVLSKRQLPEALKPNRKVVEGFSMVIEDPSHASTILKLEGQGLAVTMVRKMSPAQVQQHNTMLTLAKVSPLPRGGGVVRGGLGLRGGLITAVAAGSVALLPYAVEKLSDRLELSQKKNWSPAQQQRQTVSRPTVE